MNVSNRSALNSEAAAKLRARMAKRLEVEAYFASSGRTFRKSKGRLWFNESVKPHLLSACFKATGLYLRGVRNALTPVLRCLDVMFPKLPHAFDGFSILHLSDLHIDKMDGLVEALIPIVEPLRPDVCVLTGDYRFDIRGSCDEVYPRMRRLLAHLRPKSGIFATLGNHDASEIALQFASEGMCMLMNDSWPVVRDNSRIWFLGVDDDYDYRCHDLVQAAQDVPPDAFKILLAHTPSLYREAEASGVALYLCGHTHAGQIRLPGIGALKKNGKFPMRFAQGHWEHGNLQGYTSWGTGCSTLPVRFHCPPEITQITLRRTPD